MKMNKCTFCGRESDFHDTKIVGGYPILTCCTDCEEEIPQDQEDF
jgi:ribosome-binding protein aMBF1 (putative translation factor)